ncbi:MAG TPA: zinc-binding dehydrogenase [Gemmatimonadales bacterium]|nr:zinc-binding dehydrogenase [Gemmatimonadales bacterium]
MRALCLTATGGPEHLELLDLPMPELTRPDEVRVGIRAVALNHLDLWVANGLREVPIPAFPHVVCGDGAGVVLEVGPGVTEFTVGDRVVVNPGLSCGMCEACQAGQEVFCKQFSLLGEHRSGTAGEQVVLPARNLARLTGDWSWSQAAAFGLTTLTAWRMLTTRAQLRAGESVLIWGIGGGVALQALQIARHIGATTIVTSSSPDKLSRARELGADLALDYRDGADIPALVKQHLGSGADVVVDSVGTPTWQRSCKALRPGGRMVTCGATGGRHVDLDLRRLFWFQWSLLGSTMGTRAEFAEVVELGNAGALRPVIDTTFPLAEGEAAYRRLADAAQFGKIVLEVGP